MTDAIISNHAIIKKVGAGGMGDVYLAEDTKLRRRVALKFLSEKFSFLRLCFFLWVLSAP